MAETVPSLLTSSTNKKSPPPKKKIKKMSIDLQTQKRYGKDIATRTMPILNIGVKNYNFK